jgi:uncharacterized protein YggU (UPF0235/DUF167 family)
MYIHVRVKTGQKNEYINIIKEGYFEISVKQKPENNLANKRILEILKSYFNKNNIKMINGYRSPSKLFSVNE